MTTETLTTRTVELDWPQFTYSPTEDELAWERQYWADLAAIAEYDAHIEARALADADEAGDDEDDGYDGGEW